MIFGGGGVRRHNTDTRAALPSHYFNNKFNLLKYCAGLSQAGEGGVPTQY